MERWGTERERREKRKDCRKPERRGREGGRAVERKGKRDVGRKCAFLSYRCLSDGQFPGLLLRRIYYQDTIVHGRAFPTPHAVYAAPHLYISCNVHV